MKRSLGIRLALLTLLLFLSGVMVCAGQEPTLYNSYTEGEQLHFYVGGLETADSVSCQIGQVKCQETSIETEVEIETILLVDNSLSIDSKYHDVINQILKKLVESASEQETITIATFDTQIHYLIEKSADSEALLQTVDGISYENLDTKVTDVMYSLCKELETDPFDGLRRIVLISDGAEYSSIGYTRQEVRTELQKLAYPVYTIGCTYRNNTEDLEEMFSLSRLTGAQSVWLDEVNDPDVITETLNGCKTAVRVNITVPEELQDGASRGIRLVFQTGEGQISLSTTQNMPFLDGTETNGQTSSQQETAGTERETAEAQESRGETETESQENSGETEAESQQSSGETETEGSESSENGGMNTVKTQETNRGAETEVRESDAEAETETDVKAAWGNWNGNAGTEAGTGTEESGQASTDNAANDSKTESETKTTEATDAESEPKTAEATDAESETKTTEATDTESETKTTKATDTESETNSQQADEQKEDPLKVPLLVILLLLLVLLLLRRRKKSGNEKSGNSGRKKNKKKTGKKTDPETDFGDSETGFEDSETVYDQETGYEKETTYEEETVYRDDFAVTGEQETEYRRGENETERTLILDGSEEEEPGAQAAGFVTIRLTDMRNATRITEVPLSSVVSVGRNARGNQAVFEYEKSVSSRHCEIFLRNGRIFVRDLNSTNGTWVDDVRVEDELELYSGAVLKMGRLETIFEILDPTEDPYGTE